jgi:hypothetical protein
MEDEPHDAVKLLIARMDSHPEEFKLKDPSYHDRWYNHISAINSYGNEADTAALNAKIRDVRMAEVHERIMEELCNGPENRRKEEEDAEYERHLAASLKHAQIQQNTQNAILRIDSTGNVGVGNVMPSTQLDVAGGIRFFNK